MRRALVVGNWKMNGTRERARALVAGITDGLGRVAVAEAAVCPPFVYLEAVARRIEGTALGLGAQNMCEQDPGAFTGEIAASMLKDVGCRYVIVGHSERRHLYGETDEVVAAKYARALREGLVPIVCIGETLEEREAGRTRQVVARQLDALSALEGPGALGGAVIAYEPVWAIGTGVTASPEQAQAVHAYIRERIAEQDAAVAEAVRILYGGSVKSANAETLFAAADIDGGLIGGASLQAEEFLAICEAAR